MKSLTLPSPDAGSDIMKRMIEDDVHRDARVSATKAKGIILATEVCNDIERAMLRISNKTDELTRTSQAEEALRQGSPDVLYSAEVFVFFSWY
jgi:hypothetical protein